MTWLTDQPIGVLLVLCIGGLTLVVVAARYVGHRFYGDKAASAASIAQPMMPALGAAFAVLAAFAVANAAAGLRSAEADVSREANASARLAWASTAGGQDGVRIRADLLAYLEATLADEWRGIDRIPAGEGAAFDDLARLQASTRSLAASEDLGTPQRTELLGALDDVSASRRSRFAEAAPIAAGVVLLLVLSGVALLLNATVVTLPHHRRAAATLGSLVVVTGVSIAIVVSLGGPFSGSFTATQRPVADVASDLRAERFQLAP